MKPHAAEFPNDRPTDDTAAEIVLRNLRRTAAARARALFAALLPSGDAYELAGETLEAAAKGTGFEIATAPEAPGDVYVMQYHDGRRFLVGVDTSHGTPIFVGVDLP